ncbi:MAG: ABC transporter permease subunit [Sphingomonadales bacterium]|nr:ABC transporter permease subunit [Sphingomonadales bacterium]
MTHTQRRLAIAALPWLLLAGGLVAAYGLFATLADNLADRNIRTGFGFLFDRAGFAIGETLIDYAPGDSYAAALAVGLLNTLLISALGIIFSTLLGLAVCMARLSSNWMLARLSGLYIELVRNIPLLLQMFVWYAALLFGLPGPGSGAIGAFDLDNRGLHLPALTLAGPGRAALLIAIVACAILLGAVRRGAVRTRTALAFAGISLVPLLLWGGIDLPRAGRFGTVGGLSFSTEFLTLVTSLSVYASAYLAEIFRSAILAVPAGQSEAAKALGLSPAQTMGRIVIPQALRIAIPPMTSWHLNTIKNSSLGVAIGYPEFVSVVDTVISQTGQAIEGVGLIVATFLLLSLSLAFVTGRYARRLGWTVAGQPGRSIQSAPLEPFPLRSAAAWPSWMRRNLFRGGRQSILTIAILAMTAAFVGKGLSWLLFEATFAGGAADCRLASGACWPFLRENARLILFGTYPEAEQWRSAAAAAALLSCLAFSFVPRFWRSRLGLAWLGAIAVAVLLLRGGFAGLSYVPMEKWSGLPVTLLLASLAVVGAFPLAILLAFGRRSSRRGIRWPSIAFIELVRGTPLIGVLFLAAVLFPLFVPSYLSIDSLPRVQLALIFFTAAYMAEVIRGGLLAVPAGQAEAAQALGLTKWQARRHILLPQALKVSVPGLVNTSISEVKNTTLVLIVGVFDLLQTTRLSYVEAQWRPYFAEAYLFTGTIFFLLCFSLSRLSMKIERKLNYAG